jgi:hypothetical protein
LNAAIVPRAFAHMKRSPTPRAFAHIKRSPTPRAFAHIKRSPTLRAFAHIKHNQYDNIDSTDQLSQQNESDKPLQKIQDPTKLLVRSAVAWLHG